MVENPVDKTRYVRLPYNISLNNHFDVKAKDGYPFIIHHFDLSVGLEKYLKIISDEAGIDIYHLKKMLEINDSVKYKHLYNLFKKWFCR